MRSLLFGICLGVATLSESIASASTPVYVEKEQPAQPAERLAAFNKAVADFARASVDDESDHAVLGDLAYIAGDRAYATWNYETAIEYYDTSIGHLEAAYGSMSAKLMKPLSGLLHANIMRMRKSEVRPTSNRLEKIAKANLKQPSKERYDYHILQAQASISQRRFTRAKSHLQSAIQDAKEIPDNVALGDAYMKMSWYNINDDKRETATRYIIDAIESYQSVLADNDKRLVRAFRSLSTNYVMMGKQELAAPYAHYFNDQWGAVETGRNDPSKSEPPRYPDSDLKLYPTEWVIIEFTVTTEGTVVDPLVIESEPPGKHDRRAKKDIVKWKYSPKTEDGQPVAWRERIFLEFE